MTAREEFITQAVKRAADYDGNVCGATRQEVYDEAVVLDRVASHLMFALEAASDALFKLDHALNVGGSVHSTKDIFASVVEIISDEVGLTAEAQAALLEEAKKVGV